MKLKERRIIGKQLVNQLGIRITRFHPLNKLGCIEFKIKYKKTNKDLVDILELLSFLERLTGQKVEFYLENVIEKTNVFKINEGIFTVVLRKRRAQRFLKFFKLILLPERRDANIVETNVLDLKKRTINFKYKTLKLFRRYLLTSYNNIEANMRITLKYKSMIPGRKLNIFGEYMYYIQKKNEFYIQKKIKK